MPCDNTDITLKQIEDGSLIENIDYRVIYFGAFGVEYKKIEKKDALNDANCRIDSLRANSSLGTVDKR